jgi:hypothetical protein
VRTTLIHAYRRTGWRKITLASCDFGNGPVNGFTNNQKIRFRLFQQPLLARILGHLQHSGCDVCDVMQSVYIGQPEYTRKLKYHKNCVIFCLTAYTVGHCNVISRCTEEMTWQFQVTQWTVVTKLCLLSKAELIAWKPQCKKKPILGKLSVHSKQIWQNSDKVFL